MVPHVVMSLNLLKILMFSLISRFQSYLLKIMEERYVVLEKEELSRTSRCSGSQYLARGKIQLDLHPGTNIFLASIGIAWTSSEARRHRRLEISYTSYKP